MPWPMSYLYISENTKDFLPAKIKNLSQYYLGTIAPDAVHFRRNYTRDQKKFSHLYMDIDKSNVDLYIENWEFNVKKLYIENKSQIEFDFLLGYCTHLLADIYIYKYLYKPFQKEYCERSDLDYLKIYKNESLTIDFEIYQQFDYRNTIFPLLKEAIEIEFLHLIQKEDMDGIINNILNIQYNENQKKNGTRNEYLKYEQIMDINKSAVEYIKSGFIKELVKK